MAETNDNPYVGPVPYQRKDADRYFGREEEAELLLSLLVSERVVLLHAPSGAGKSSLLNTRIIPSIEDRNYEILPLVRFTRDLPVGVSDVENIYVFSALYTLSGKRGIKTLKGQTLKQFFARRYAEKKDARPHWLIFDQFEELLTIFPEQTNDKREEFFAQLQEALDEDPKLSVLFVLRADYLAELERYAPLLTDRLRPRHGLERLNPEAALEAVCGPAAKFGRPFEEDAARELVANLSLIRVEGQDKTYPSDYVEPVQLQIVCFRLWENLRQVPGKTITASDVRQYGDVNKALEDFYDDAVARVAAQTGIRPTTLRRWFSEELITPTRVRAQVSRTFLRSGKLSNKAVDLFLDKEHIVRTEQARGGKWIELAHDTFIEPILKANERRLPKAKSELSEASKRWHEENDESYLFRGNRLREARRWYDENQDTASELERDFIFASINAESNRSRIWYAAAVVFFLAFCATGVFAVRTSGKSKEAEEKFLAAQSQLDEAEKKWKEAEEDRQEAERKLDDANKERGHARSELARANELMLKEHELRQVAEKAQNDLRAEKAHAVQLQRQAEGAAALAQTAQEVAEQQREMARENLALANRRLQEEKAAKGEAAREGKFAESRLLSLTASSFKETDPEMGALLAAAAIDNLKDVAVPEYDYKTAVVKYKATNGAEQVLRGMLSSLTRVEKVFREHGQDTELGGAVNSASFSPDGRRVVTAGTDETARVWSLDTADVLVLRGHTAPLTWASFSPDGSRVATASLDKTARVWDAKSGALLSELKGHAGAITCAAFDPGGKYLATGGADKTARVWEVKSGAEFKVLSGHTSAISAIAFNPDGDQVATEAGDRTGRLWDLKGGGFKELSDLSGPFSAIAYNKKGNLLVSENGVEGGYGHVAVWDTKTGTQIRKLRGPRNYVSRVAFSPDGKYVLAGGATGQVLVWLTSNWQEIAELRSDEGAVVWADFSPDGELIVTSNQGNNVELWDRKTGEHIALLRGHRARVYSATFSPDGRHVVSAGRDGTSRVWSVNKGQTVVDSFRASTRPVFAVSAGFEPSGGGAGDEKAQCSDRMEIITAAGSTAQIFRPENGRGKLELGGRDGTHPAGVRSAVYSKQCDLIVTTGEDGARIWTTSGKALHTLVGHTGRVWRAAFSHDSKLVVTAGDDATARVWETATGRQVAVLKGHAQSVNSASFSPDGATVVTASEDGTAIVWNLATGKQDFRFRLDDHIVYRAEYSPDGKLIVTADAAGIVRVWNAATGTLVDVLRGHMGIVYSASFSPDGKYLVTASEDGTARVWDTANWNIVTTLSGHRGAVYDAAFDPKGNHIVTASEDGMVRIFSGEFFIPYSGLETLLAKRVGRTLPPERWRTILYDEESPSQ